MWPLTSLLLCLAIANLASLSARIIVARMAHAHIEEITVFLGPELFRLQVKGILIKVHLLPLTAGLKLADQDENIKASVDSKLESPETGLAMFHSLPASVRVAIFASSDLALVFAACICLGPFAGLRSTWLGFGQVLGGGFAPLTYGERLVGQLDVIFEEGRFWTGLGLVCAKMAAFNMMPWPPADGGQVLLELVEASIGRKLEYRYHFHMIGILIILILFGSWTIAFCRVQFDWH